MTVATVYARELELLRTTASAGAPTMRIESGRPPVLRAKRHAPATRLVRRHDRPGGRVALELGGQSVVAELADPSR